MERHERERSLLVVEDDDATRSFLVENLTADGFRVAAAAGERKGCGRSRSAGLTSSCST